MRRVGELVYVTADEMASLDQGAIKNYRIDVLSLMENAGSATALLARRLLGEMVGEKKVACLIGRGNNGGDGLVASRHLTNWGADVKLILSSAKEKLGDTAALQLATLEAMGLEAIEKTPVLGGFDLLIDALLGYSSRGPPREPVASMIRNANESGVPILAIDIPSGLDSTTGEPSEPCIRASTTLTLGLPKTGFLNNRCRPFVGELFLGDVSLPRGVYSSVGQPRSPFESAPVVKVPW